MLDEYRPAVLRGFDTAVADLGDQLHLCQPLLSFEGDPTLYVARRLDWRNDRKALAPADPFEASELGTLLPDTPRRTIASGEAVVAVGAGFVRAAKAAGVQFDGPETDFAMVGDAECRIGVATPARFAEIKTRLADEARTAFDEELGDAARRGRHLSERGNAALLLLRRCGPSRRDDLAVRQLAGARQNRELDLYRRLLIRFALELHTREDDLDERAMRHVELAKAPLLHTTLGPSPAPEYDSIYLPDHKVSALGSLLAIARKMESGQHGPAPNSLSISWQTLGPNTGFSAAMEESNSGNELRLDIGDAGEGVQRNPDYIYLMFEQFKRHLSEPPLFASKTRNQTIAALREVSRERATYGYFPGGVASIQTMKNQQTKNSPAISLAVQTVTAKGVVDNVNNREAA